MEAMKMETEIVAPAAGTVASVNVSVGDAVDTGAVLVTLNSVSYTHLDVYKRQPYGRKDHYRSVS